MFFFFFWSKRRTSKWRRVSWHRKLVKKTKTKKKKQKQQKQKRQKTQNNHKTPPPQKKYKKRPHQQTAGRASRGPFAAIFWTFLFKSSIFCTFVRHNYWSQNNTEKISPKKSATENKTAGEKCWTKLLAKPNLNTLCKMASCFLSATWVKQL